MRGETTIKKLLKDFEFTKVVDVGAGQGLQAEAFAKAGKKVVAIDPGISCYARNGQKQHENIKWEKLWAEDRLLSRYAANCLFACHVLEHIPDVQEFLWCCSRDLGDDLPLAFVVPWPSDRLAGGHVNNFSLATLVYSLVLTGIDCSGALVHQGDEKTREFSVIVRNVEREILAQTGVEDTLTMDAGDVNRLKQWFPRRWVEQTNGELEGVKSRLLENVW